MQKIPIEQLQKAEWNYKTDNANLLKKLVANIKKNGQIENLIIREIAVGSYEIVNGNHRLDALKQLEIAEAWCYNLGTISDNQAKRIAVETNETRFEMEIDKFEGILHEINIDFSVEDLSETMPYDVKEINQMIDDIINDDNNSPGTIEEQSTVDTKPSNKCPECGHEW